MHEQGNRPEWWLWGKARPPEGAEGPEWHPLICHMLDVMNVADALLDRLPRAARSILYAPFDGEGSARRWLRFLVALHDMGKATPGFQGKWQGIADRQRELGIAPADEECHPHGTSGTALLVRLLADASFLGAEALDHATARALGRAVAAHHGEFAIDKEAEDCAWEDAGGVKPCSGPGPRSQWPGEFPSTHRALVHLLRDVATSGEPLGPVKDVTPLPGFVLGLAGLTCVADWLGSDAGVFRYQALPVDPSEYQRLSQLRALQVLDKVGWIQVEPAEPRSFAELFSKAPRPLQEVTIELAADMDAPCLVIVEATMGDGKTEAALYLSEVLARQVGQSGLFFGLPTQATANQMLARVETFLRKAHAHGDNLQLVHGDAALSERFQELRLRAVYGQEGHDRKRAAGEQVAARVAAEEWFTRSKRALLANYAVGTVDQSLLGVLPTRHAFVRLFGLSGKTVVLDEVHAYDTYTSQLLDRVVAWSSVLGASVVVLSATLPRKRRDALVRAYGSAPAGVEAPYPRITVARTGQVAASRATRTWKPSQVVGLKKLCDDRATLVDLLGDALKEGACVAWICNTVERAQRAYLALRCARQRGALDQDVDIDLLHSRLLRKDRQARERDAERCFGPPDESRTRPRRAVLVGTQVLEQSLDLDFDLMISDLAPIDLILQRAGRLHRHQRARPAAHTEPRFWLVMPDAPGGVPDFSCVASVYEPDVMFRSWWELEKVDELRIPEDLEAWIERVYGDAGSVPEPDALARRLAEVEEEARRKRRTDWSKAQAQLLFNPVPPPLDDPFGNASARLTEDDDSVHRSLRAQTRLGDETVDVVCLWQQADGLALDRGGKRPVSVEGPLAFPDIRELLHHSVKLAYRDRPEQGLGAPASWREQAALRHKKMLVFEPNGEADGIILHEELGLVLRRLAKELRKCRVLT
jgi:CRISPR-associated endonuclease/helicase Cas3